MSQQQDVSVSLRLSRQIDDRVSQLAKQELEARSVVFRRLIKLGLQSDLAAGLVVADD